MQSPMGKKNLAVLLGWLYYQGRLKFHDLRALMTNTSYIPGTFLEQLFSLINTGMKISRTVLKKLPKFLQQVHFMCTVV